MAEDDRVVLLEDRFNVSLGENKKVVRSRNEDGEPTDIRPTYEITVMSVYTNDEKTMAKTLELTQIELCDEVKEVTQEEVENRIKEVIEVV